MQEITNILFIKLKSMGDVVFTLPALNLVRENFPAARITCLTSAENQPIVAAFAGVDEVLVLDRGVYKRGDLPAIAAQTGGLLRRLRRGKFSLAMDFQCYAETAALARFTGARQRWGYQLGGRLRRLAYTRALPRPADLHPVDANLELLRRFGLKAAPVRNELRLPEQGRDEAQRLLAELNLRPDERALFIQPFTSSPGKNWPLAKYLAVAGHWKARGLHVVFGGGPGDSEALRPVTKAGFTLFAGLPLATVAWVLERSNIVVGGDTGLLHLAVALGRRVLMLMSPPGPGSSTPYGHKDWVVSPPAGRTLADLAVDVVSESTTEALRG